MEFFTKHDPDHCYLLPLKPASQPTCVNASYSDSEDGKGEKFVITSLQPTPILKKYMLKQRRLSLPAASFDRARKLAEKSLAR